MKIAKRFTVEAPLDEVWRFIAVPEQVASCVPGCEMVEAAGASRYRAAIKVQVGPIKTRFNVDVEITEERAPEYFAYATTGEEGGRASRLRAESALTLKRVNDRETEVQYTSDIQVVGRLGKFGLGMMMKKADVMGDEFVAALRERLEDTGSATVVPAAAVVERQRTTDWLWIGVLGAAAALLLWLYFALT